MKKLIIFTTLIFLAPILSFAAYTDVIMSESAVISVGGYSLVVSGTANLDSITVNESNFSLSLSKNASLTVTSSDKRNFTVSPSQYAQSFSCGASNSTLTVGNNLWDEAVTVTVTPSATACSIGGGSGSGGGGGGGGGGGVPTPVQTTIPGTPTAPTVAQPSPVAQVVSPVFNTALRYGVTSNDVSRLQQLFAQDKEIYPEGIVSGWFGQLTRKALQKFQCKHDIVCSGDESTTGYGLLGPKTRAKIQAIFGTQAQTTTPTTPTPTPSSQAQIDQLQKQIKELLNQIKSLQEQLKAL